jgi:hypothetical protein
MVRMGMKWKVWVRLGRELEGRRKVKGRPRGKERGSDRVGEAIPSSILVRLYRE